MNNGLKKVAVAAICLCCMGGIVHAEEEMDKIISDAAPYMHHSCGSVIEIYGEDEDKVAEIVRHMAMVSLYNRQIDVLAAAPEEAESGELRDEFVEELEDSCDDDPGMLLAGAVDIAIKETMELYD